jgi:GxxExxY protein
MKKRKDLIYPELSYKLVGLMFTVHNEIGGGLKEKTYEKALKVIFEKERIRFKEHVNMPITINEEKVGNRFLDFLVEDKVIIELKAGEVFKSEYIRQVSEYLKATGLKLGLLVNFGRDKVAIKRVVNEN